MRSPGWPVPWKYPMTPLEREMASGERSWMADVFIPERLKTTGTVAIRSD